MEAVTIMSKIALEAEAAVFHRNRFDELRRLTPKPTTTVQTTAIAAVDASFAQNAAAIITLTTTGRCVHMHRHVYTCAVLYIPCYSDSLIVFCCEHTSSYMYACNHMREVIKESRIKFCEGQMLA